jgi:hypothetical protein
MAQQTEDRQLHEIAEALHQARQWDDLFAAPSDWMQVIPGSALSGDDRATKPYPVSQAACNFMLAAISHLQGLREVLGVPKDPADFQMLLHTHAGFTLARGAFENASGAVWLLDPDDRHERVLRRLRQVWAEMKDLDKVCELADLPAPRPRAERVAKLEAIAQASGCELSDLRNRDGSGYKDTIRAAGKYIFRDPNRAEVIWKACSSLAHGETLGLYAYSDRNVAGDVSPGVGLVGFTASVSLLHAAVMAAVATMPVARRLYAKRAQ